MIYCHVIPPTGDEAIEDLNDVGVEKLREFTYTVEWRPVRAYIKCNCRKFEFNGFLCCHIMQMMCQKDIEIVDDKHLLTRWRKDMYRRHSSIFVAGYPHMTTELYKKYQEVERSFKSVLMMQWKV
ncbi:hypothetical protein ACS0TY_027258 [Phlomoides rotata]